MTKSGYELAADADQPYRRGAICYRMSAFAEVNGAVRFTGTEIAGHWGRSRIRYFLDKCTGCPSCQLICSLTNDGVCGPSRSRVLVHAEDLVVHVDFVTDCDEYARCSTFRPYGAIRKGD